MAAEDHKPGEGKMFVHMNYFILSTHTSKKWETNDNHDPDIRELQL